MEATLFAVAVRAASVPFPATEFKGLEASSFQSEHARARHLRRIRIRMMRPTARLAASAPES